jgi:hypothetical protein
MIYQIYVLDELGNALSMDLVDCATEYEAKEKAAAMVDFGVAIDTSLA